MFNLYRPTQCNTFQIFLYRLSKYDQYWVKYKKFRIFLKVFFKNGSNFFIFKTIISRLLNLTVITSNDTRNYAGNYADFALQVIFEP